MVRVIISVILLLEVLRRITARLVTPSKSSPIVQNFTPNLFSPITHIPYLFLLKALICFNFFQNEKNYFTLFYYYLTKCIAFLLFGLRV